MSILFLSAAISFFRGFIREVLTIIGLAGAVVAALIWGKIVGGVFGGFLEGFGDGPRKLIWGILPAEVTGLILGYLLTFLFIFAILGVISHFIGKAVHDLGLNAVDRTLGFVFGIARGFVLLGVLFIVVTWVDVKDRPTWLTQAKMTPILVETAEWIKRLIPDDEISEKLREQKEQKPSQDDKSGDVQDLLKQKTLQNLFTKPDENNNNEKTGTGYKPEQRRALDELLQQTEE